MFSMNSKSTLSHFPLMLSPLHPPLPHCLVAPLSLLHATTPLPSPSPTSNNHLTPSSVSLTNSLLLCNPGQFVQNICPNPSYTFKLVFPPHSSRNTRSYSSPSSLNGSRPASWKNAGGSPVKSGLSRGEKSGEAGSGLPSTDRKRDLDSGVEGVRTGSLCASTRDLYSSLHFSGTAPGLRSAGTQRYLSISC